MAKMEAGEEGKPSEFCLIVTISKYNMNPGIELGMTLQLIILHHSNDLTTFPRIQTHYETSLYE